MRGIAAATAALLIAVTAPSADAYCASTPTKQAFKRFGDNADYSLAPGGSFESGTSGWSLTKAAVASGNEPFKVGSPSDAKSLALQATGTAVSAPICVGVEHPTFRLFARRTSGSWGVLTIKLRWTDPNGTTNETVVASAGGDTYTSWAPTPPINLAGPLGLWKKGSSVNVRIVFDPEDYGGAWAIDDLYIDPYRR
jgi:hypothetical protein